MPGLLTRSALATLIVGLLVYAVLPYIYPHYKLLPDLDPRAPSNTVLVPGELHDTGPEVNDSKFGESFARFFELGEGEETNEPVIEEQSSEETPELSDESEDSGESLNSTDVGYASLGAKLIVLSNAKAQKAGALCLNGLPPGYYYRPGWGLGARSWIVFLRGGEGCTTEKECYLRSKTSLGSVHKSRKWRRLGGIMSGDKQRNPEFHNWNGVSLIYCDGFSFAGDRLSPMVYNGTEMYSRGRRVLDAIFTDLLRSGMAGAERVILFGHSAGGLGALLNSDRLRRLLPPGVDFKLLVISFLQPKFPQGSYARGVKKLLQNMATIHNISGTLPSDCVKNYPSKEHACLLPSILIPLQSVDAFYVNSVYDRWSMGNLLRIRCEPNRCRKSKTRNKLQGWSAAFAEQVPSMLKPNDGVFVANCVTHMIALDDRTWFSTKVGGKTIAEAFGDWYFGRGYNHTHLDCFSLDCYPNPTCA
ncbi:pectin acetylesterase 3-like [Branchiostoma floridae]|uniref:Pectin acetylesterase 3-like n=1 Tax=Branchiostoma floridae TaxID=7739 RepID=A0A9J7N1B5_BRAFL|nr:pectin acetylesterase 3-like [Branchiostoma floridae]